MQLPQNMTRRRMLQMATGALMASAAPELFAQQAMPTIGQLLNLRARRYEASTNKFVRDTIQNLLNPQTVLQKAGNLLQTVVGNAPQNRILIFMAHAEGCLYESGTLSPRLAAFSEVIRENLTSQAKQQNTAVIPILLAPDYSVWRQSALEARVPDDRLTLEKGANTQNFMLLFDDQKGWPTINAFRFRGGGEFMIAIESQRAMPAIGIGAWTLRDAALSYGPSKINISQSFDALIKRGVLGGNADGLVLSLNKKLNPQLAITQSLPMACAL